MQLKERHQFIADFVLHTRCQRKVQRLTGNRVQLVGNILQIIINKDRCLVNGQLLANGQLSETTIVGNQTNQILSTSLHSQHNRTMHQGNILWQVRQILHAVVHRERDVHHVALLPLTADGHITGRTSDDADGLTVYL